MGGIVGKLRKFYKNLLKSKIKKNFFLGQSYFTTIINCHNRGFLGNPSKIIILGAYRMGGLAGKSKKNKQICFKKNKKNKVCYPRV